MEKADWITGHLREQLDHGRRAVGFPLIRCSDPLSVEDEAVFDEGATGVSARFTNREGGAGRSTSHAAVTRWFSAG